MPRTSVKNSNGRRSQTPFGSAVRLVTVLCIGFSSLLISHPACAYPEFEIYVEEVAERYVNCAMCHTHADGPEGLKPGQIGSLSNEAMQRLFEGRQAFEPGSEVDNPILNEFGDYIIHELGRRRFLELRLEPEELSNVLPQEHDLDGDGIPDVDEYMGGTDPLDRHHGGPAELFMINLKRKWFHILMLGLATVFGLFGLNNLLEGFRRENLRRELEETGEISEEAVAEPVTSPTSGVES